MAKNLLVFFYKLEIFSRFKGIKNAYRFVDIIFRKWNLFLNILLNPNSAKGREGVNMHLMIISKTT